MNNQKKTHELIRQNEQTVKKSQKHDANLQKNSTLFFQVGLIACLLVVYGLFEMRFETTIPKVVENDPPNMEYVDNVPIYKPEVKVVEERVKSTVKVKSEKFVEVPDTTPDIFISDTPEEKTQSGPIIDPSDFNTIEPPEEVNVRFDAIEVVPIYPGCEKKKTNGAKRKCMSEKINKLVQRKFDTGLGDDLGLYGKQVIRTEFKIDKTGRVINIKVRGPHPDLEAEAKRVINKIPEMTPGKQRDKNVGVIYSLPIVFHAQN